MITRLVLVCHASTTATRAARFPDDEPLDTRGASQAAAASGALRRIDQVRCGPERRCRETATALGLRDLAVDSALADLDVGTWRGKGLAELEGTDPTALHAWLTDTSAAPHGGEPLLDLLARVAGWLDGLRASHGRIVAVTHASVIRAAVLHVLQAPPSGFWRLDVAPLSHTVLSSNGGRWTVRQTGHPLLTTPEPQPTTMDATGPQER
ncbi:histidine phosphatase family protein [Gandjariella thermophila]|uniref:Phosphoglycerate mutase n=1 Tax=Gandjariella thermophila TaxID=1931992 RepID=A0A4D4JD60_9PSEU|nr:histidine phosphatase family protein [Gandjariella thermophila]GDY31803.1 phosphoglycerate mutase [Gandjariella thermophila]